MFSKRTMISLKVFTVMALALGIFVQVAGNIQPPGT